MLITDPIKFNGKIFEGKMTKEAIQRFISNIAFLGDRAIRNFEVPLEMSKDRLSHGHCSSQDGFICVIIRDNLSYPCKKLDLIKTLIKKYQSDFVSFYYILSEKINHNEWNSKFGNSNIILVKGKRNKAKGYMIDIENNLNELDVGIESISSGNISQMQRLESLSILLNK